MDDCHIFATPAYCSACVVIGWTSLEARCNAVNPWKNKRLTEDGFTNQASNEALRKLQAQQDDVHDVLQHEQHINTNPDVQAAESIVELLLSNVDDWATPAFVLQRLREHFSGAKSYGKPGYSDLQRHSLFGLGADEAVLSVRKLEPFLDKSGKVRRRGCAIAELPTDAVAEFFCSASQHQWSGPRSQQKASQARSPLVAQGHGINCAPAGRRARCVNIKRNNVKRRQGRGGTGSTTRPVAVSTVAVIDMDFRERQTGGPHGPVYRARQLWEASLESAGIEHLSRCIQLRPSSSATVAVDLRTIKHIKTLKVSNRPPCLALRLRRPPHLEGNFQGTDPSQCEAFASPTAYLCLSFHNARDCSATEKALKKFQLRVHREILAVTMHGSQHASVCGGISHRLPHDLAPLTPDDLADAGESEYEVSFLLDLLLRHGHLRAADVPAVLGMLRCLYAWGDVKGYSEYLYEAADGLPAFHRGNDGTAVITTVRNMYDRGRHVRQQESNGYLVFDDDSGRQEAATRPGQLAQLEVLQKAPLAAPLPEIPEGAGNGAQSSSHSTTTAAELEEEEGEEEEEEEEEEGETEEDEEEEEGPGEEDEGFMYPRRVLVTPLRALPYLGAPEVSNRIIRRYSKFEDRFLRVAFASERLGSISHTDLTDAVCGRISTLLECGLVVGNCPFVFLAFSNSQLRQHSCWLYCEKGRRAAGAPSADDIRQSVGELAALRTPSKFAARLGQGFSTTYETFRFQPHEICEIPDVAARNAARDLFSDGVGVITSEGMRKVESKLPVRMRRQLAGLLPSAIQIRLGGCKGMLTRWDGKGFGRMEPGALVGVRPSMKKFESADLAVEVCGLARPMPAFINRQLIMALLALGIPDSVFMKRYQRHVRQLDHLLTGGEEALTVLRAMGAYAAHSAKGVSVAQGSLPACMIEAGVSPRHDPFLLSMCQAYRTFALKSVEDKCRMPLEDGVNLMGVMDESGSLPAGTFWARWDRDRGRRHPGSATADPAFRALPRGTRALVTRFPCLAPADVRVLRAADPAMLPHELTDLTNVIVFPSVGNSPEPCKMSGGDLDGDIYLISWDTALVPEREAAAVDYTPARKPEEQILPVQVDQIVRFFIDYMKNDQLGRIANGHLAIADFAENESGTRVYSDNDKCHQLVQLHSTAVDFAKTGIPVDPDVVTEVMKGEKVPDYLGGTDVSTTVIGKITRAAKERIAEAGEELEARPRDVPRLWQYVDAQLLLPPRRTALEDAEYLLGDWTYDVAQLMRRFGAQDVGQVFSGRVREFHGRAAGREKQADHQKQLDTELAKMVERHQRWWFPDVEPADVGSTLGSESMSHAARSGIAAGGAAAMSAVSTLAAVDPGSWEDMLCAASALYDAAYTGAPGASVQEQLIRRACPWRVAPRLLLEIKLYKQ
eukprot:jgi/Ulvmu1/6011/UM026_0137.1